MGGTYLLIHGAWYGKWCWEEVIPLLEKSGNQALSIDLPGHGECSSDLKEISLNIYVQKLLSIVQDLRVPVVLVGHSMAGLIISKVADLIPEKIRALVYLTAFVPRLNQSLMSMSRSFRLPGLLPVMDFNHKEQIIELRKDQSLKDILLNQCVEKKADKILKQLKPQPVKPFQERILWDKDGFKKIPKAYIVCVQDKVIHPFDQLKMANSINCDIYHLPNADHSAFYSDPKGFVEVLKNLDAKN